MWATMDIAAVLTELERVFRGVRSDEIFKVLRDRITHRGDNTALFTPCLPVIGAKYKEDGILVLATAQNWRDGDPSTGTTPELYRQWPNSAPALDGVHSHEEVAIEPWKSGMLPALVGVYLHAHDQELPESLDEVASRCAITNFFKFSLRSRAGGKDKDMNPQLLPSQERDDYIRLTFEHFVMPELEILKPGVIISFARPWAKQRRLRDWTDSHRPRSVEILDINDPAWIKNGMRRSIWRTGNDAPDWLCRYLDQTASPYRDGKRDAATRYLLHYLGEHPS